MALPKSRKKSPRTGINHQKRANKQEAVSSPEELASSAQSLARRGLFKEAAKQFRQLQQAQPGIPQWRKGLSECYRGRALELGDKQLYKEALVFWDNLLALDAPVFWSDTPAVESYLDCLVNAGAFTKAAEMLIEHDGSLMPLAGAKRLLCHLALQLLIDNKDCRAVLERAAFSAKTVQVDDDSDKTSAVTLLRQCEIAKQALLAYCGRDEEQLDALLRQIPHRSPYRDFCQLLKALRVFDHGQRPQQALLARINPASAFYPLANTLLSFSAGQQQAMETLISAPPQVQILLNELGGMPRDALKLWRNAGPHLSTNKPKEALQFFLSCKKLIPKKRLQQICLGLIRHYPQGVKLYEKHCGRLSPFASRLPALAAAAREDARDPTKEYRLLCDTLEIDDPAFTTDLRAAVLRRIARLAGLMGDGSYMPVSAQKALEQSVNLEPGHKPTYLKLLQVAAENQSKSYHRLVDRAVVEFSQDREVLNLAIEAAIDKGAYKKAVGLANKLLKIDALNSQAKNSLVTAHLSHARKQLRGKKYAAAEKELKAAQEAAPQGLETGIFQTLLHFQQGDANRAQQAFVDTGKSCDNVLLPYLLLSIEVQALNGTAKAKSVNALMKPIAGRFSLPKNTCPQQLLDCLRYLRRQQQRDLSQQQFALESVTSSIKTLAKKLTQHNDFLFGCEFLYEVHSYSLLKIVSDLARKRFKTDLTFEFYHLWAGAEGEIFHLDFRGRMRFERLQSQAQEQGENRVLQLLLEFASTGMDAYYEDEYFDEDDDDFVDEMTPAEIAELLQIMARLSAASSPAQAEKILNSLDPDQRERLEDMVDMMESAPGENTLFPPFDNSGRGGF